ncbi:hypothetical protein [Desulforamulus ruminis]|uniref:Uncharacterized protein n=1 Tax=Desulforamulus ruminis (strain ATCC 23193 / DSM 2154 / NCIMB 8452 / DL) TaxID=696281 RepID=F6DKH4_DESRL|nr:hypothetical protein [Desulforamulus ruminis]AEG59234.1 hypothetical protein Desru_0958 [Desulforamulus ruminis DSM 2154]
MEEKVKNYYRANRLYGGHRMMVPAAGEKFRNSCQKCKFFVTVMGRQEARKICVTEIKAYRSGAKRVPEHIEILDLILLLGKESLEEMIKKGRQQPMACGEFVGRQE